MTTPYRKTQPLGVRYIYEAIRSSKSGQLSSEQLGRTLRTHAHYTKELANEVIVNAIHDKILIPVSKTSNSTSKSRTNDVKVFRLPKLSEIPSSHHDWFCFECHLPGDLEHCSQCVRAFHRTCYRKDPERPNYKLPSSKNQKNRLPAFSSDNDSDADDADVSADTNSINETNRTISSLAVQQENIEDILNGTISFSKQSNEELIIDSTSSPLTTHSADAVDAKSFIEYPSVDVKTKLDVMCLGEVRPPNRRSVPATYKNELLPVEDDLDAELELCTHCRLMKRATLSNPPNVEPDELCYLLSSTYFRNKTWVQVEVFSTVSSLKISDMETAVLSKLLFKIYANYLNIEEKIKKSEYKYLNEFLVDILSVQHNIGIYYGDSSTEFESTKWLVRDITHDLSEIRRCSDCFRYSYEKTPGWFCKPCVQRHELVFAKHGGFSYWPAKVIRVLPNNKYDVRFFGSNHSRALVDVKNIRSIDTDYKSLKLGKSSAIKKAMEELNHYQILKLYSPSIFSFRADKEKTNEILNRVLERNVSVTPTNRLNISEISTQHNLSQSEKDQYLNDYTYHQSIEQQQRKRKRTSSPNRRSVTRVTRSSQMVPLNVKKIKHDLDIALKLDSDSRNKISKLQNQNQLLKDAIAKHELEKKIIKRKQWCFWCLNEAIYLCCFKASYCSQTCQERHWKDGHNKVCKNKDIETQNSRATSTT